MQASEARENAETGLGVVNPVGMRARRVRLLRRLSQLKSTSTSSTYLSRHLRRSSGKTLRTSRSRSSKKSRKVLRRKTRTMREGVFVSLPASEPLSNFRSSPSEVRASSLPVVQLAGPQAVNRNLLTGHGGEGGSDLGEGPGGGIPPGVEMAEEHAVEPPAGGEPGNEIARLVVGKVSMAAAEALARPGADFGGGVQEVFVVVGMNEDPVGGGKGFGHPPRAMPGVSGVAEAETGLSLSDEPT